VFKGGRDSLPNKETQAMTTATAQETTEMTDTPEQAPEAKSTWRRRRARGPARTDAHRPGAIIPAHYESVCYYILPGMTEPGWNQKEASEIMREGKVGIRFEREGHRSGLGQCDVCGAFFRYGAIFLHTPTKALINMGQDCAGKYEMMANWSQLELEAKRLHEARGRAIQAKLNAEARAKYLEARPELTATFAEGERAWNKAEAESRDFIKAPRAASILRDMHERLLRYHRLTESQEKLALKLAEQLRNPPPPRKEEAKVPAPTGRIKIRGTVISLKPHETDFGTTTKMTIKVTTEAGIWLAWGTMPAEMGRVETPLANDPETFAVSWEPVHGREVELTATITPSDRDPSFAFFKRPTKARLLPKAEEATA
jgi:hypothetical protein